MTADAIVVYDYCPRCDTRHGAHERCCALSTKSSQYRSQAAPRLDEYDAEPLAEPPARRELSPAWGERRARR